jgi:hypothetical protein
VRDGERRLDDFVGWFAERASKLLSVQRILNLTKCFPDTLTTGLRAFAGFAAGAGDARWKRYQPKSDEDADFRPRSGKGIAQPNLHLPQALMLRMRAGFGVGAKADLLSFLIGIDGSASIREASEAIDYTEVAVRTAAQEMALAGFVNADSSSRPTRYAVPVDPWSSLLGLKRRSGERSGERPWPIWRHWADVFAFYAAVPVWVNEGRNNAWSPYVWSARARDLVESHTRAFTTTIGLPSARERTGPQYLESFSDSVGKLCEWTRDHL